ncbi:MAG: SAM-dependent methyltransferase, partial [Clostridia bacterium]|nr:SAM-dependent methyltransferase [Clostridia bacterium]
MRYEDFDALHLRVLQPDGVERFGVDAILLADFAARGLRKRDRLLDLGTGNGIVALLLTARG